MKNLHSRFLSFTAARVSIVIAVGIVLLPTVSVGQDQALMELKQGDRICYIGNTLADRMQHYPWLETYLAKLYPEYDLTFRNLGFSADELKTRPRSANFGSADQWLTKCGADVVFCFFGYNEALKGEAGLPQFKKDLAETIDQMRTQKYNGESAPRLVFFSPIAHENLESPHLPDGKANNGNLSAYTDAMQAVCQEKQVPFVDLFSISQGLYEKSAEPLTMNGIHLSEDGYRKLAAALLPVLSAGQRADQAASVVSGDTAELYNAVCDKNYHWFSRYRVVDGYNVFGGRSKLAWFDQSNADVMMREMEMFDVMTDNRDKKINAVLKGQPYEVKDENLPEGLVVKANKAGPLDEGAWPYLGGEEAISKMTVHDNMKVNLFASEEMFPRLINPVQISFDADSRLFVACWESYPHWNPSQPRKDCIMILPDNDGDGVADESIIFADQLNSVTGFEFWGGGLLVAAPPEIWFLKDTDGDDRADVKIRMLQGISSADTHHSANALLVGADGWLYFSRGIFNVANFETPTKTFRSGQSGVHRFNPRTFEFEFHFPIGPNPHGDVFDQWGYQFANDGTGGTGSYVNIGKGVGNKTWFKKRVRPVPSNGILSSSHFPPEHDGNFLISNAIGFLGVAQHTIAYDGADITATEVDPLLFSDDPNFRPSDMEVGGDGALYIADWHNALIGHMQHNMRDPNRDRTHGRVYRVTYEGRPLVKAPRMKGKPVGEVCQNFFSGETATRYRARLELSGRSPEAIVEQVGAFAAKLDPQQVSDNRDEAQALLECLWVFEEQRIPNLDLLKRVYTAKDPRVRAAAIRTLGHWAGRVDDWQGTLAAAASDPSGLVRAEAVKAAVDLGGLDGAEAIFAANTLPLDPEMETVLKYAKSQLNIDTVLKQMLATGNQLSDGARAYILATGTPNDLEQLEPAEDVHRAILAHPQAKPAQMQTAIEGLSQATRTPPVKLIVDLIAGEQVKEDGNVVGLGKLLAAQPVADLARIQGEVQDLATNGATPDIKRLGYATWVAAAGPGDAFLAATKSKESLRDFLDAVPIVNRKARGSLFEKVQPLIFELPQNLASETGGGTMNQGVRVGYLTPHAANATNKTVDERPAQVTANQPNFEIFIPQGKPGDQFTNVFEAMIEIPESGKYEFFTTSDDGSRLYLDGKDLVNNDGAHGMATKSGAVNLAAGFYPLRVNYFDSGGAHGLKVEWSGPGFKRQPIPAESLFTGDGETLHEVAIRAMVSIPGYDSEKFDALTRLLASGKFQPAAIKALQRVAPKGWNPAEIEPLVDNIVGYLSALPVNQRTSKSAVDAIGLARKLGKTMPKAEQLDLEKRLENLDVRVIAIGTVPHRMIYDKEKIVVEAGKPVEFRFSNTDSMPHNFAITLPGALAEVGEMAEATGRDADAMARHYIPSSEKVLVGSTLLQPGESEAISFNVPDKPGVYPYVCTYPGHWRRMYGALYVVPSFQSYVAANDQYLDELNLEIADELLEMNTRGQQWKYDDLIGDVNMLMGRSHEVGKAAFKAANCIACHQFGGEGQNFGPDLHKLTDEKRTAAHILRSMLEPSLDIDDQYAANIFLLETGDTISGLVMEEDDDVVKIVVDPLAKDQLTSLNKAQIEGRKKAKVSQMPEGMVDKLSREEIIDLVAYVLSNADPKHKVFEGGHDHANHEP
ncbi:MAG: PA14 domain-containing protein [Mariniblastus sp.]|nr:PA14 domain-containing protein [Mariniblastus sp.]